MGSQGSSAVETPGAAQPELLAAAAGTCAVTAGACAAAVSHPPKRESSKSQIGSQGPSEALRHNVRGFNPRIGRQGGFGRPWCWYDARASRNRLAAAGEEPLRGLTNFPSVAMGG